MKTRTLRKWLCASALLMMTGAVTSGCAGLGDDDSLGAQNQNLQPGQGSLPGWDIGEPDPQQPGEAPSPDSSMTSCEDILRTIDPNADPASQVGAREAFARCVEAQNPSPQAPGADAAQVCDPILERLQYVMDPAEADQIIQAHADCLMSFDGVDGPGPSCELVYAPDGTRHEVCGQAPAPDADASQVCDPILEGLQYTMDPQVIELLIQAHIECLTLVAQPQAPTPDDASQVCDPILERLQYTMDPVEADQIIRAHADCLSSFHGDDGSSPGCEPSYNPDGSPRQECGAPDPFEVCDPILERLQYTMDQVEVDQIIQAHADCLSSFHEDDGSGCELIYNPDGTRYEVCMP